MASKRVFKCPLKLLKKSLTKNYFLEKNWGKKIKLKNIEVVYVKSNGLKTTKCVINLVF